jgi:pimeloyl-ACP methyl ester carboxylesterase
MSRFTSFDGVGLSYDVQGFGPAVVLQHGFASNSFINWVRPGLADLIADAGRQVVMLDARGHGGSDKPHEPQAYADGAMAKDVRALADHMGLERFDMVGYSMGAGIALHLCTSEPRVRSAVLGGIGVAALDPGARNRNAIAQALEADDKSSVTDPTARSFRDFADVTRADRLALAAIQRAPNRQPPPDPAAVQVPVLVIVGDSDPLATAHDTLAERIPGARNVVVGGTHLNVVNNPAFHRAVLDFLEEVSGS